MNPGPLRGAELDELETLLERLFFRVPSITDAIVVTQALTLTDNDNVDLVLVNATAGAVTITLPTPFGPRERCVLKTDASGNAVTVSAGTSTINGAGTYVLAAQYNRVTVRAGNSQWYIVSL